MPSARQIIRASRRLRHMSVDRAVVLDHGTRRILGLDNLQDLADLLNSLPARR